MVATTAVQWRAHPIHAAVIVGDRAMMSEAMKAAALFFLALSIVAHGYSDALPAEWMKWAADTATVATGLAALFSKPPGAT